MRCKCSPTALLNYKTINKKIMKQLFKEEELTGKTIAQTIMPKESCGYIFIKFTDNSFVVFDSEDNSTGFSNMGYTLVISDYVIDNTDKNLVTLGLITNEQYESALEEEEKRYEQQRIDRDNREKESQEKAEREYAVILKNKYGL